MADPSIPTYATGQMSFNNDVLNDSSSLPTGSTTAGGGVNAKFAQHRTRGVGTSNADWDNGGLSGNILPKAFPGLQS